MDEFDYEEKTRQRYQNADRARIYHSKFAGGDPKQVRARYVTHRERGMLRKMLSGYMPGTVLDVPCGTGKMAPVLADLGATVVCADISEQMIHIAREEYERLGHGAVEFITCDAESIAGNVGGRSFDVACCVRLMHRVPAEVRRGILAELAKVAPVAVISYAVTSPLQRIRNRVLDKKGAVSGEFTRSEIEEELTERFTILSARPISRGVCSEWFFLVKAP